MANKIKILHAITRLDKGGSAENTLISAIGLAEKGYDVTLLFGKTEDANVELLKRAREAGVEFVEEEDLVRNIRPVKDLAALFDIRRFIKDNKFDIVHAHSSKAGIICRVAAWLAGVKNIVYTPHGHVFYGYFGKALTSMIIFAERAAALFTERIIGLTPCECEEWLTFGVGKREQYLAIPSGLEFGKMESDLFEGRDLRKELGIPSGKKLVGSVGRFVPIKGYEYFIEAAAALIKNGKDLYFALAGDGPLAGKYEEMISSLGIEERFHIVGWQENTGAFMRSLDLFVLSSLNEGMGRVLVMAMYYGKPVIATRVGGVPSVVA
ncbi:MAG: glycosyltransferase, partial [Candidatus Tantalella remota]|nr:glycosyltransferase [Candidatus Tantalella remota]